MSQNEDAVQWIACEHIYMHTTPTCTNSFIMSPPAACGRSLPRIRYLWSLQQVFDSWLDIRPWLCTGLSAGASTCNHFSCKGFVSYLIHFNLVGCVNEMPNTKGARGGLSSAGSLIYHLFYQVEERIEGPEEGVFNKHTLIPVEPLFHMKDFMGTRKDRLTQGWSIMNPGDRVFLLIQQIEIHLRHRRSIGYLSCCDHLYIFFFGG